MGKEVVSPLRQRMIEDMNARKLGKLAIHKSDQGDSCKIEPFWPQTHQRVTAVSQNALDRRCDDPGRDRRDAMMSSRWCRCGTDKQAVFIMSNQSDAPLNSNRHRPSGCSSRFNAIRPVR
jgi:hypothetical protein